MIVVVIVIVMMRVIVIVVVIVGMGMRSAVGVSMPMVGRRTRRACLHGLNAEPFRFAAAAFHAHNAPRKLG